MLNSNLEGRRKPYRVNAQHPLTSDITSVVRKVADFDTVIERVVESLPRLKQVCICQDLTEGIPSGSIDCISIGEDLDSEYIAELSGIVYKLVGKKVNTQVTTEIKDEIISDSLLIWEMYTGRTISGFKGAFNNSKNKEGYSGKQ